MTSSISSITAAIVADDGDSLMLTPIFYRRMRDLSFDQLIAEPYLLNTELRWHKLLATLVRQSGQPTLRPQSTLVLSTMPLRDFEGHRCMLANLVTLCGNVALLFSGAARWTRWEYRPPDFATSRCFV